ncbi:uncharacterized protein LY79DRAFT_246868 [Colletotrichum navitas]|uniref:Uncharacterized protein n=1 Tax=Colletotrichum navitas TaxID=681940 RepID=A0AAD8QAP9_9PEZI|nr:uncharacterized protein LY79DRAFT_246868 [Colletotrichum navitas]KAK1598526.1 hypothetical protein LY79DRAFT_246868 [Colletotrichum navitas]
MPLPCQRVDIADPRLTDSRRPLGFPRRGIPIIGRPPAYTYAVCATLRASRPRCSAMLPRASRRTCTYCRALCSGRMEMQWQAYYYAVRIEESLDRTPGPLHTNTTETATVIKAIVVYRYFQQIRPTEWPLPRSMATRDNAHGHCKWGGNHWRPGREVGSSVYSRWVR